MAPGPIMPLRAPVVDDPEKARLGKLLFADVRLSGNESASCASCLDLSAGGDDGRQVPVGFDGRNGYVNTPTVLNSSLNSAQFWDGRAKTLEEQIDLTVTNPIEMGGDWPTIIRKLGVDQLMAARFASIYDDASVSRTNVIDALAAYLRVLVTPDAPMDRFLAGNNSAISENERAGFELFKRMGCVSCHQGRNIGGNFFQHFGVMGDYFADRGNVTDADLGRYNVTGRDEDRYKFKVPSLRNVAETAPYFHDGSAPTLEAAVEIMIQYQLGRPATPEEIRLLVGFLGTLSGEINGEWL